MMTIKKINLSCDYITVAFICTSAILCRDSRYAAAVFCTVCHELGHIAVMLRYGCERVDVKINLFNIAISDKLRRVRPYKQDAAIICAGPLVNFCMLLIFLAANVLYSCELFYNTAVISGVLCVFNLLPIESTDGGQLLEIALGRFFSQRTVRSVMTAFTVVFTVLLGVLGVYVLIRSRYNYTLLFSSVYFCLMIIMKVGERKT